VEFKLEDEMKQKSIDNFEANFPGASKTPSEVELSLALKLLAALKDKDAQAAKIEELRTDISGYRRTVSEQHERIKTLEAENAKVKEFLATELANLRVEHPRTLPALSSAHSRPGNYGAPLAIRSFDMVQALCGRLLCSPAGIARGQRLCRGSPGRTIGCERIDRMKDNLVWIKSSACDIINMLVSRPTPNWKYPPLLMLLHQDGGILLQE
jgi:hypothetical protein